MCPKTRSGRCRDHPSYFYTNFLHTFSVNGILSLGEYAEVETFCLVEVAPLPGQRLEVGESRGKRLLVHSPATAKEFREEKVTQLQIRPTKVILEAILQKSIIYRLT